MITTNTLITSPGPINGLWLIIIFLFGLLCLVMGLYNLKLKEHSEDIKKKARENALKHKKEVFKK